MSATNSDRGILSRLHAACLTGLLSRGAEPRMALKIALEQFHLLKAEIAQLGDEGLQLQSRIDNAGVVAAREHARNLANQLATTRLFLADANHRIDQLTNERDCARENSDAD